MKDSLRVATIEAMKNMGMEKWKEANDHLTSALTLDPFNEELQQMHDIVKAQL
jgi:hypothetical protein